MARRKVQQAGEPQDVEDVQDYESAEPEVIDEPQPEPVADIVSSLDEPLGYVPDPNEGQYRITLALPFSVLVALIDPMHPLASVEGAEHYGVLANGVPTPMGQKVLDGCDQIAIRHKMLTAYRTAHNAGL